MKNIDEGHAWEFKRVAAIFPSKSDMIFILSFFNGLHYMIVPVREPGQMSIMNPDKYVFFY